MKTHLLSLVFFTASFISCYANQNEWVELFNGKNLNGWKAYESPGSFHVENGLLVCSGPSGHLFYECDKPYKNFELIAEIKTEPFANSGIFFHTSPQEKGVLKKGYEVQVNNTYSGRNNYRETKKTGSLYAVRNVYYPVANDNEWFRMRIKVIENHVEIYVNEMKVVDYIQPENPWRSEARKGRLLSDGTFALQAHDEKSTAYFKSIKVRTLPEGNKSPVIVDEAWETIVAKLMDKGFPLIDYHVHLKGGLTLDQVKENSLKLGINYGVSPNCGFKFPITNDASLAAYLDTVKGQPIFRGMQAEGREWVTLFTPEAVAKFDYVFTDAMTFTDSKGRRNRIWLADEVWVDDKQEFMEQLVSKIEAIFSHEPVDIYVNPMVLPTVLMPEYDLLWTKERIERVIKVLANNGIALEINARYKTPNAWMIRMAKNAGIKFTLGTNNITRDLGTLDYCLKMVAECGLTADDIFMPKTFDKKPVMLKGLPKNVIK